MKDLNPYILKGNTKCVFFRIRLPSVNIMLLLHTCYVNQSVVYLYYYSILYVYQILIHFSA